MTLDKKEKEFKLGDYVFCVGEHWGGSFTRCGRIKEIKLGYGDKKNYIAEPVYPDTVKETFSLHQETYVVFKVKNEEDLFFIQREIELAQHKRDKEFVEEKKRAEQRNETIGNTLVKGLKKIIKKYEG